MVLYQDISRHVLEGAKFAYKVDVIFWDSAVNEVSLNCKGRVD
jgi:hypothetical protein